MTPSVAAGRALYLIEHPHAHPTTWEAIKQEVRDWWISRAQPITDAVQGAAA